MSELARGDRVVIRPRQGFKSLNLALYQNTRATVIDALNPPSSVCLVKVDRVLGGGGRDRVTFYKDDLEKLSVLDLIAEQL